MLPTNRAILFADDEASDRFLMSQAWKEVGITQRLAAVEDGEEAVDYLTGAGAFADRAKNPLPCLVILDLNMPRMNGFETLQWIRKSEQWKVLPVIVLSASAHPRDVALAYSLGAFAYVTKPSTANELIELVSAIKAFWLRFDELPPE